MLAFSGVCVGCVFDDECFSIGLSFDQNKNLLPKTETQTANSYQLI